MSKTHIRLNKKDVPSLALVCGDPERAKVIASFLKGSQPLSQNREYHSYKGSHQGKEILITSHGVGSAGAAICFNELIDVGVSTIVRVGTAGALYDDFKTGDIIIPTGAIRKDGVSSLMVPVEYPAVPDSLITTRLLSAFKEKNIPFRSGIILTSDLFYPGILDPQLELYKRANAVGVEMECSTLFIIGLLRQIRTAAVLCVDGNPLKWKEGHYNPMANELKQAIEKAFMVTLDVMAELPQAN